MRRRNLITLIFALAMGIAAGVIVMVTSKKTTGVATAEKTVKVVVMARGHRPGVKLTEKDILMKDWPERLMSSQYIQNKKEVIDRVITKEVSKDEPLLRDKLAPEGSQEGLSNRIPEGYRAFSVKITDATGVSGYILPESRVDVIVTVEVEDSTRKQGRPSSVTKTILQNVMVLAVGAEKEATQEKTQIKAPTVTLALTPEQGEKLTLAATRGSIRLSLRNQRYDDQVVSKTISLEDLISGSQGSAARTEVKKAPKPPPVVKKEKTVPVMVMKRSLGRGARLTGLDLEKQEWPERSVSSNIVQESKEALGRYLIANVVKGEPLLRSKLVPADSGKGVSTLIPKGMRAFSVNIKDATGVSGLLLPGSRVDVLGTFEVENSNERGGKPSLVTKTILQDVEILTANSKTGTGKEGGPAGAMLVTLIVTPEQGEKLTLAAARGSIRLSIRNPGDEQLIKSKTVSVSDLVPIRPRKTEPKLPKERIVRIQKEKTVPVLVMKHRLERGVKLTEDDFEIKDWPERLASADYIRKPEDVLGKVLVTSAVKGEPLLREKIASGNGAQGLSGIIPEGRRAFAVKVDEVTGVSGFLLPGSKVDVIVTVEMDKDSLGKSEEKKLSLLSVMGGDKVSLTRTILQDVEVLAAGSKTEVDQERGRIETKVVTLLLTPEQGQILTLAATKGKIHLAMRNPRDKKSVQSSVVSINDLLNLKLKEPKKTGKKVSVDSSPAPKEEPPPPPPPHIVEVLQGGKRSKVEFQEPKP